MEILSSPIPDTQTELLALYDRIQKLIATFKKQDLDLSPDYPLFIDWMNLVSCLELKACSFGHGLFTKDTVVPGDILLEIPHNYFLKPIQHSDPLIQRSESLRLALALIQEYENPDSFWRPYIHCLPTQFTTPLYQDIHIYAGTSIVREAVMILLMLLKQYYHVKNFMDIKWNVFLWASSIVMSRQNNTPFGLALIPFFDFLNKGPEPATSEFSMESQSCITTACKHYAIGEQVYISYGDRPNQDLLLYSGFVDASFIENDRIRLPVSLNTKDPQYNQKAALLQQNYLGTKMTIELFYPPLERTLTPPVETFLGIVVGQDKIVEWLKLKCMVGLRTSSDTDIAKLEKRLYSAILSKI